MKNKQILILGFLIILISFFNVKAQYYGEITNGHTNVRDTINGNIRFCLFDNVTVESWELSNKDWYDIGILIKINENQFKNGKILKGENLFVTDSEQVGIAITEIPIFDSFISNDSNTYVYISGYIYKENIKTDSILENTFLAFLKTILNTRTLKEIKPFIDKYEFEKYDLKRYTEFDLYDNTFANPSPQIRLGFVFENDILIAIIHCRELKINGTTDYKIDSTFGIGCLIFDTYSEKNKLLRTIDPYTYRD